MGQSTGTSNYICTEMTFPYICIFQHMLADEPAGWMMEIHVSWESSLKALYVNKLDLSPKKQECS